MALSSYPKIRNLRSKDFDSDAVGYEIREGDWSPEIMVEALRSE